MAPTVTCLGVEFENQEQDACAFVGNLLLGAAPCQPSGSIWVWASAPPNYFVLHSSLHLDLRAAQCRRHCCESCCWRSRWL